MINCFKEPTVMMLTGKEIIEKSKGRLLQGNPEKQVSGCAIDSRQASAGTLFVPFAGQHTDGHLYIAQAAEQGAVAAFSEPGKALELNLPPDFLLVEVEDTLTALQQLAAAYRKKFDLTVVGITGSSGKTTTKDFIAGVLAAKYKVLKTTGNLNNEIGLPLTILQLKEDHQVAVLEMGMSAAGEIGTLCEIAAPSIGVITNIGEAHIELLGSVEAIARAKGELLDYLGSGGVAVLNGDDPRLLDLGKRFPGKVYYYGFNQGDIKGLQLSQRGEKSFSRVRFPNNTEEWFESPLPGRESVSNALAALTVAYILKLSLPEMQKGLKASEFSAGRFQVLHNKDGITIIDDTYNANPSSVRAALRVLADLEKPYKAAVLGDMLELGETAKEAHHSVGRFAAECGLDCLVTVGELARHMAEAAAVAGVRVYPCPDHECALRALQKLNLGNDWAVLVKGSRGMQMEVIVQSLSSAEGDDR
ncbi:MAG: UDP-N-acetylmuramoyl-tripeptide--D-alanyl-D-alanine ligase [Bacillota bacterium]